jgi:cysteine desulfurase/selenocysteine lyase
MNEHSEQAMASSALQELFPGASVGTYLSTCTRGLLPSSAKEALIAHLTDLENGTTDKPKIFEKVETVRKSFADLVHCHSDEVAFTKNVSEGLNIIATAIDWNAGDNVIVCLEMEHPNNVYPWLNLRDRIGIEVRVVPPRDGHVDTGRLIEQMDDRTRLVTLPTVSFSPGFLTDVATVGKACREQGVFLLADGVQSVGILDTNVGTLGVDGLVVSTQKGLCGLYGMGFLYCRREWAEQFTPAYLARFGVDLGPDAHEATMGLDQYSLMPGARRFDLGNYNFPGITVAEQSLSILNNIGTKAIEAHVMRLSRQLIDGLLEQGLTVAGGEAGAHTSSLVCIGELGTGHDSSDDPKINSLSAHLDANNVAHSIRRGMVRFAFHIYNSHEDVEQVLSLIRNWKSKNT